MAAPLALEKTYRLSDRVCHPFLIAKQTCTA
jgi:hypothetical protein